MREKLQQEVNQEPYTVRAHTAEAPYGCIKQNWKFTHVRRRGITKAAMEVALLFSLHNILKLGAILHRYSTDMSKSRGPIFKLTA